METLGEKHKHFNNMLHKTLEHDPNIQIQEIDYEDLDINNFLKIDLACKTRNAEYVLNVFKSEDMLYVCRAMKHSVWLVQEPQYAHLVNPTYLSTELFPYMMTEARNKLLLHIRLHLKDPLRNEEFFKYLVDIDLNAAMKWLPKCSVQFIESRLEQDIYRIPENIFLRLLWITIEPLKCYVKNYYWKKPMLEKAMFVINIYGDEYFNILDSLEVGQIPKFNDKYTKLVMKTCPQRLLFKLDRYENFIDKTILVKYLRKEDFEKIKDNIPSKNYDFLLHNENQKRIKTQVDENKLFQDLQECSSENFTKIREILQSFLDSFISIVCKKLKLQIVIYIIRKFNTHRFDQKTWDLMNDVYKKIGVYDNHCKRHFKICIKSIISYKVLHNEVIPEDLILKLPLKFNTVEMNKFNTEEKEKIFHFLYNIATKNIEMATDYEVLQNSLENCYSLFKDWGKDFKEFPLFVTKVENFIKSLRETNNIEAMKKLYDSKKSIWRIYLFKESILIEFSANSVINMLKHDPNIFRTNKIESCNLNSKDNKLYRNLLEKIRIYWPDSLAKDIKNDLMSNFPTNISVALFRLISKKEFSSIVENHFTADKAAIKDIAKYMYKTRPKPPIEMVLSYGKRSYICDTISCLKSILHSMSCYQTMEHIKLQDWPEFVQKLCVFQIFAKLKKEDKKEMILKMWENTKYSSVRADIFKMAYKSLKQYNKNDMNHNDGYKDKVRDEWNFLKQLLERLTINESVVVYSLLSKFEKVPLEVRSEYCITGYTILKKLPPRCNCRRFMNRIVSKIEYNKVLHSLDTDFVAEMVQDTIITRLWSEKLDWTFMNMLFFCISSQSDESKRNEVYQKILFPVLDAAYNMWHTKTHGIFLARYNIHDFLSRVNSSYKDLLQARKFTALNPLLQNLQRNFELKENYVQITNLKLAVKYLSLLSKYDEQVSPKRLYENTITELSQICIETFCKDVATLSSSIWKLYFHALQMMFNGFRIPKSTQYKIANNMLDLSNDLTTDLNILVHKIILDQIFYVEYGNEDKKGRKALRDRIANHPLNEIKVLCSKMIIADGCNIPYYSFFRFS